MARQKVKEPTQIQSKPIKERPTRSNSAVPKEPKARIQVCDDGSKLPAEFTKRIWKPGESGNPNGQTSFRETIKQMGALMSKKTFQGVKLNYLQASVLAAFERALAGDSRAIHFLATHSEGSKLVIDNLEFAARLAEVALDFIPEGRHEEFMERLQGVLALDKVV